MVFMEFTDNQLTNLDGLLTGFVHRFAAGTSVSGCIFPNEFSAFSDINLRWSSNGKLP